MKTEFFFAACFFACFSAYSQGDGSVSEASVKGSNMIVCSLNKVKQNVKTIPLSSLVENCELVQLEFNEDALFNPWFTTVTDKYIGVRQQGQGPYKLFDRSGKFLCSVGSIGRGPGEYAISLYDDLIDDQNGLVYLAPMTGNKILVFNTSGKFVKNIVAPHPLRKPKIFLKDGILTVVHMAFKDDKAIAIQFDVETGSVIKELAPPAHLLVGNFDGEIFNTRCTSAFDFLHTSSDTLYHFDVANNKIQPVFLMTFSSSEKPFKQTYELNPNLFLTNIFGKGLVLTDAKAKTSTYVKVENDYYGHMNAPTYVVQLRNGYYAYNLEPGQLKDNIEKRLAESACTDQDKQTLNKILSTLDEEANNYVFIGKLRTR